MKDKNSSTSSSIDLPSASTNTRNVEDGEDSIRPEVAATRTVTSTTPATATVTTTTVVRGVSNVPPDAPDTASSSPTKRPRKGRGRFLASKGHAGGNPMVDDDHDQCRPVAATTAAAAREATIDVVDPDLLAAVDTESHGRTTSVSDVEAVVPSPEPTTLSTTSAAPILEAYLAHESGRRATVEVVGAVVWDDTDIRRSDMQKWALLFGGTLLVGAVIVVVAMSELSWTRNKNVVINDPPSSAPTTILSSTVRLVDILREIMTHFESPTLEQDLKNPKSPQYRAALWMAEEDEHPATANLTYPLNQTSFDLLQFRQRYALSTFYYATGGDEWKDQCNFLSPSRHVCDWNCEWDTEPFERLDSFVKFSDSVLNGTVMGALCGRSVQNVSEIMPTPVLDNLVVSLVIGKYFGCSSRFPKR